MTNAKSGDSIEAAITDVVRGRRAGVEAAFRASVEQRLHGLEADLAEVKSRLNGLLFCIVGTVITQVLLKVLA